MWFKYIDSSRRRRIPQSIRIHYTPIQTRILLIAFAIVAIVASMRLSPMLPGGDATEVVARMGSGYSAKTVALTFDDGPDERYTPAILDELSSKNIKATFFVVGEAARANPDLILLEALDGHELGNHTWSHAALDDVPWHVTVREIAATQDVVMQISGLRTCYFRPPRGRYGIEDIKAAKAMGYKIVMWDAAIETKTTQEPEQMANRVLNKTKPGAIILLHDGGQNRETTVAALPFLIDGLKKRGYSFATVSELLSKQ